MRRRNIIASVGVLVVAAIFARLGVWQLHRLGERRARNAEVAARTAIAPASLAELPPDTAHALYRRVRMTGVYDYSREFVLTGRTLNGSPGVYIYTPLHVLGATRAVLVNRGWVYSPDAFSVDLRKWREQDTVTITGFVEEFPSVQGLPEGDDARKWRELDGNRLARVLPYGVEPYYVVILPSGGPPRSDEIARLSPPPLDEGPHKSYAIQWFSFAAIALFGLVLLVRQDRTGGTSHQWRDGVESSESVGQ
jgi:surfeit locus 1 family protein